MYIRIVHAYASYIIVVTTVRGVRVVVVRTRTGTHARTVDYGTKQETEKDTLFRPHHRI